MAWTKIPAENHPLFLDALPKDRRVSTVRMFGGLAGLVNGNMFGGLFARSAVVRLSQEDQKLALALDGAEPFDPMGNGRVMRDTILLPEAVMGDRDELRSWLGRALDFTATLPRKVKAAPKAKAPKQAPVARRAPRKAKAAASPTKAKPPAVARRTARPSGRGRSS
ncbi:MAG: TfoX/Sxy family protein [Deltaproteobacteria bacterium]|nr:TfoX/Sxy family protein [Deltaproteobacteria bacterium]